jgi:tetratricopeptide (TPR) repeat protein
MSLVGRNEELARARDVLERGLAGRASLVLFVGEAGIGKTSLADALAQTATERGANVAWGRCWEAGGAPSYWPWMEIFRAIGDVDPFAQSSQTGTAEAEQTRFRTFERAASSLRAAARERPLVVLLDDLHAADMPSLLFLHLVARGLRAGGKLVVVGTYRDAEARLAEGAFAVLSKIGREGEVVHVGRLGREEVVAWTRERHPNASADVAARVHEVTEGNPLFVHEVLTSRAILDPAHVPDGLRAILDQHVARASAELRELLTTASVMGREATTEDIAAISGKSVDAVTTKMKEAHEAGLSVYASGSSERHAFAHMLIREHLYRELPAARRAELHASCGERLAKAGHFAGAAHHLFQGSGPMGRAAIVARDAALAAIARLAFEDAGELVQRALSILPTELRESPLACELETILAESLIRSGDGAKGKEAAVRAAEMAKHFGWSSQLAQAALVYGAEMTSAFVDPVMVDLLRAALSGLGEADSTLRARVTARLASALVPTEDADEIAEILRLAGDARAMARRLGDPDALLYTLRFGSAATGYTVFAKDRLAYVREAAELATQLGRSVLLVEMGAVWAGALRESGLRQESEAAIDSYLKLLHEFPQPYYQWRGPLVLATHAVLDGDLERADRLARQSFEISSGASVFPGMVSWAIHRVARAVLLREPIGDDAERVLGVFGRVPPRTSFVAPFSAMLLASVGRRAEARELVAKKVMLLTSFPLIVTMGCLAVLIEDVELAKTLVDPLIAVRNDNTMFWSMHCTGLFGPTPQIAGELCVMLGRTDEARGLFDEAIVVGERLSSPTLIANAKKARDALGGTAAKADNKEAREAPSTRPSARTEITITQEGDVWRIRASTGGEAVLKDAKGLHYLAELVRNPGRELHVTQLADMLEPAGDAGPVLDSKAKDAYKKRLEDLRDQLEEARRFNDEARASRAEVEIDALVEQLAKALGLGGRDRKIGSHVERARVNVQRRIKDVLRRVEEQDTTLGRYLSGTTKTGTWCVFTPI